MGEIIVMKKLIILIIILFLSSCDPGYTLSYQSLPPQYVQKEIDRLKGDVYILDVRTQEEYDTGHVKNAILIPEDQLLEKAEEILTDKDKNIFVYSGMDNKSQKAAKLLISLKYHYVYDFGNIILWEGEIEQE